MSAKDHPTRGAELISNALTRMYLQVMKLRLQVKQAEARGRRVQKVGPRDSFEARLKGIVKAVSSAPADNRLANKLVSAMKSTESNIRPKKD